MTKWEDKCALTSRFRSLNMVQILPLKSLHQDLNQDLNLVQDQGQNQRVDKQLHLKRRSK